MLPSEFAQTPGSAESVGEISALHQMVLKHRQRVGAGRRSPRQEMLRFSFEYAQMRDWTMCVLDRYASTNEAAFVDCDTSARLERLDRLRCDAQIDSSPTKLVRNGIEALFVIKNVVFANKHCMAPVAGFERQIRKRLQLCPLHLLEATTPTARKLLERPIVENCQASSQLGIQLSQAEEHHIP